MSNLIIPVSLLADPAYRALSPQVRDMLILLYEHHGDCERFTANAADEALYLRNPHTTYSHMRDLIRAELLIVIGDSPNVPGVTRVFSFRHPIYAMEAA